MQQKVVPSGDAVGRVDRLARELVGLTAVAVAEAGVEFTLVQYRLLVLLVDAGPLDQKDVAAVTHRSPSTISRTVARLEQRGLVKRVRAQDDLRRRVVELTSEGRKLIEHVLAVRAGLIAARLADATSEEIRVMVQGVDVLTTLLGGRG